MVLVGVVENGVVVLLVVGGLLVVGVISYSSEKFLAVQNHILYKHRGKSNRRRRRPKDANHDGKHSIV